MTTATTPREAIKNSDGSTSLMVEITYSPRYGYLYLDTGHSVIGVPVDQGPESEKAEGVERIKEALLRHPHRCSECPDCGPPTDDRLCAAEGCEGLASVHDSFCTPECAEGLCPNCGQPRTAMACAPDECKP